MPENTLEMSNGTSRQRRNLLIVTLIIIFIEHAGLRFGDEVKILWASATIKNPHFIHLSLWLSQIYFLWRFYQYFHTDNAFHNLKQQYRKSLDNKLDSSILEEIFIRLPDRNSLLEGSYSYSKLESKNENHYEIIASVVKNEENEKYSIVIPKNKIERHRPIALMKFLFRGKIITDYYLPYLLFLYSIAIFLYNKSLHTTVFGSA